MTTHPFVRFPWRVGLTAAVAALVLGRPGGCFLFFFASLGAFFLSSHLGVSIRFLFGVDVPVLPENYAFRWVLFWVGCYVYGVFCFAVLVGLIEYNFLVPLLGFVVLVQAVYGVYFMWCYLAGRFGRPTLSSPTDDDGVPAPLLAVPAVGGFFTRTGRGEITTAVIAATGVLGGGYLTYRREIEKMTRQHDLEMARVVHQHKTDQLKLITDFDKYKLSYKKLKLEQANTMQRHLDQSGAGYRRVNDDFDDVTYPISLFGSQKRVVRTEPTPPDQSFDSTGLPSPCEPFVGPAWWIEFTLTVDPGWVVLGVGSVGFVWWATRTVRRYRRG